MHKREACLLSLSLELLRMGLCLGELQGGVAGCRSGAILPSGPFNSLQLDTFKKLFIPYGKLSISAVLATMHLECRLPLAIKLFLSDYFLSQTGWSLWSGVHTGCSMQGSLPRSDRAGYHSQLHFLEMWEQVKSNILGRNHNSVQEKVYNQASMNGGVREVKLGTEKI